jgi:flavodoxin
VRTLKTVVVYMSIYHNNTEKVSKVIADPLSADLKKADQTDPFSLSDYDLLGFGSGIYDGKPARACLV